MEGPYRALQTRFCITHHGKHIKRAYDAFGRSCVTVTTRTISHHLEISLLSERVTSQIATFRRVRSYQKQPRDGSCTRALESQALWTDRAKDRHVRPLWWRTALFARCHHGGQLTQSGYRHLSRARAVHARCARRRARGVWCGHERPWRMRSSPCSRTPRAQWPSARPEHGPKEPQRST